jgi:hypothetical protein
MAEKWTIGVEWPERHWYSDPELVLTFFGQELPYAVAVELCRDEDGPFVTGVSVRRHTLAGWDGRTRTHVSPRDVQRLPLARIVTAALAAAATVEQPTDPVPFVGQLPGTGIERIPGRPHQLMYDYRDDEQRERFPPRPEHQWAEDARKILVPRGRPKRGKSASFYKDIGKNHREFAAMGLSPVKEIGRRKRVSENTVHQWVHRARALGFLEPSPRSQKRKEDES